MNIYEKLAAVQQELKAPKDKKNTFAGYSYRSAEGILEAVKPVLAKYKATIVLDDSLEEKDGRFYIEARAIFIDIEHDWDDRRTLEVRAYAREAAEKKGLDVSQVTVTASSYARKYALNGLLLIDDTKDPDTDEYAKQTGEEPKEEKPKEKKEDKPLTQYASEAHIKTIEIMAKKLGLSVDKITKKPLEQFTANEACQLILELKKRLGE